MKLEISSHISGDNCLIIAVKATNSYKFIEANINIHTREVIIEHCYDEQLVEFIHLNLSHSSDSLYSHTHHVLDYAQRMAIAPNDTDLEWYGVEITDLVFWILAVITRPILDSDDEKTLIYAIGSGCINILNGLNRVYAQANTNLEFSITEQAIRKYLHSQYGY